MMLVNLLNNVSQYKSSVVSEGFSLYPITAQPSRFSMGTLYIYCYRNVTNR